MTTVHSYLASGISEATEQKQAITWYNMKALILLHLSSNHLFDYINLITNQYMYMTGKPSSFVEMQPVLLISFT